MQAMVLLPLSTPSLPFPASRSPLSPFSTLPLTPKVIHPSSPLSPKPAQTALMVLGRGGEGRRRRGGTG
eukprot:1499949-Rhodomonas_salina.1